ncbi:MAG: mechanosensitive ion channel [Salinivirgaceae bacterium]|nr:mechanosensitive ion channel [Salinivirgaceae bacterium]
MKSYIFLLSLLLSITTLFANSPTDSLVVKTDSLKRADSTLIIVADSAIMKNRPDSLLAKVADDLSPESILEYISGVKIFYTLLILLLTYFMLKIVTKILTIWGELSTKRRVTMKGLIPLLRILVWIGAIAFIIVSVLRPPMASLLAFGASIGVAVGFASQDLLKNIFGGITIIFDRPFKVGDKVSIGEFYGEITEIGLRSTRMVTPDDSLISVPNAELMNTSVSNANAGEDNCQVVTDLYLPLHADTDKARAFAYQAAAVSPHIFVNKPIVVLFQQEIIGHRLVLRMRVKAYVNDTRKEFAFKSHITEILTKELFIKENINPMLIDDK